MEQVHVVRQVVGFFNRTPKIREATNVIEKATGTATASRQRKKANAIRTIDTFLPTHLGLQNFASS